MVVIGLVVVVVFVCVSGGNVNQSRLLSMATNTDKQTQVSEYGKSVVSKSASLLSWNLQSLPVIYFCGRRNPYKLLVLGGASLELGQVGRASKAFLSFGSVRIRLLSTKQMDEGRSSFRLPNYIEFRRLHSNGLLLSSTAILPCHSMHLQEH